MPGASLRDLGQVVLESGPPRRLSYTWHNDQPEMKTIVGWSDARFEELVKVLLSKITFDGEPVGETVKVTGRMTGSSRGVGC